jgi:hypothetical protein
VNVISVSVVLSVILSTAFSSSLHSGSSKPSRGQDVDVVGACNRVQAKRRNHAVTNNVSDVINDRQQKNNLDAPDASLVRCLDDNVSLVFVRPDFAFYRPRSEIGKKVSRDALAWLQKQQVISLGAHCCLTPVGAEALRPSAMAHFSKAIDDEQYASPSHPSTTDFGALSA